MSSLRSRLTAWLELMRISNLPTVVSNVLAGVFLGLGPNDQGARASLTVLGDGLARTWPVFAAGGLFYLAGMVLNDVADAFVDRAERPGRPIPSRRIRRAHALAFCLVLLAAGGLLVGLGQSTLALTLAATLVACIVLYDLLHHLSAWTIGLLGACRGLLYGLGAASCGPPPAWRWVLPAALVLATYTVALSLIARGEAASPRRIKVVLWMLAGISLLDGLWLMLLGWPAPAGAALLCFVATALGHRRILGT